MQLGKAGPPTPSEWEAHTIALGTSSERFTIAFHVRDGEELLDVCDRKSRPRIKEIVRGAAHNGPSLGNLTQP